jgi:hypothetical protein
LPVRTPSPSPLAVEPLGMPCPLVAVMPEPPTEKPEPTERPEPAVVPEPTTEPDPASPVNFTDAPPHDAATAQMATAATTAMTCGNGLGL